MTDLKLRCACGRILGRAREVTPDTTNRVVCHCDGCTRYAHALGRAAEILDRLGGSEVIQISPRRLELTAGLEHLGCMRMTERGALRWFATCCRTPLAHTLPSARLPFMSVSPVCLDWGDVPREVRVGPVRARVNGRFARGHVPPEASRRALLSMLAHYAPLFVGWLIRGDARASPFFDPRTRAPRCLPRGPEPGP